MDLGEFFRISDFMTEKYFWEVLKSKVKIKKNVFFGRFPLKSELKQGP